MENKSNALMDAIRGSQILRIMLLGLLILLLHIPIAMIQSVIGERQQTRRHAADEIAEKWGGMQTVVGPLLVVPYQIKTTTQVESGKFQTRFETSYAFFLPESLRLSGKLQSEVRYRGIFKLPVYQMALSIAGQFLRPDFSEWKIDPELIRWERAYLTLSIADPHAIADQPTLTWNRDALGFLPGAGEAAPERSGIHADLKNRLQADAFGFDCLLRLRGAESAQFAPVGKDTQLALESNWPDPSFQGRWLPTQRDITPEKFEAKWSIPFLGRNYPQQWLAAEPREKLINASLFGVSLIAPVDEYRMAERSVKYATLFLGLTFATLWIFETLAKLRIHSVQYLLVGAGMCLFYLLELALAEHLGFVAAYCLASLAVVALVSLYCAAILRSPGRAVIMTALLSVLYGYLYLLLRDQDYALLIGSLGLFVILALIMYLTRRVDWSASKS